MDFTPERQYIIDEKIPYIIDAIYQVNNIYFIGNKDLPSKGMEFEALILSSTIIIKRVQYLVKGEWTSLYGKLHGAIYRIGDELDIWKCEYDNYDFLLKRFALYEKQLESLKEETFIPAKIAFNLIKTPLIFESGDNTSLAENMSLINKINQISIILNNFVDNLLKDGKGGFTLFKPLT